MSYRIDVIYFDGEVIGFETSSRMPDAPLILSTCRPVSLDFYFSDIRGNPVNPAADTTLACGQLLLTWHDRLLTSVENNICWMQDSKNSRFLRAESFNINTPELKSLQREIADANDFTDPYIDCDLSIVIFAGSDERQMQLFFTLPCRIAKV